jgi:hypothetical protein
MKQTMVTVQILVVIMSLLVAGKLNSQTDEQLLQEAIQVVRDFVGDQSLTPLFTGEENRIFFFEGPHRIFEFFWIPGYSYIKVRVNPMPVSIVRWSKTEDTWLPYVNTNLPEKNDKELLTLAQNYAILNFPGWNDFPFWQSKIVGRIKESGYGKIVRIRIIWFQPYFVNDNGDKIIFVPAACTVCIEPYEGHIVSFSWAYNLKMTLPRSQLNPTISPLEAEAIAEQKVREWVAQQLAKAGYSIPNDVVFEATLSDPNDPDQGWWGDSRLVIGATETSGLRLAYRIDKIQAKNVNTGEILDEWIYALIDAHTGEILRYPDRVSALPESPLRSHHSFIPSNRFLAAGIFILIVITILVILCTLLYMRRKEILFL